MIRIPSAVLLLLLLTLPVGAREQVPAYEVPEALTSVTSARPELVARLIADVVGERPERSEEAWRVLDSGGGRQ